MIATLSSLANRVPALSIAALASLLVSVHAEDSIRPNVLFILADQWRAQAFGHAGDSNVFTPHLDTGDFVVVVNADKVQVTGNKLDGKTYFRYSGYMGHEKHIPLRKMQEEHPERVIELAVKGMLPKNNLGRLIRKKLKIYAGPTHPHEAQQPQPLEI